MVTMDELDVRPTEIVYITAINLEDRTFFAQQCKYSNEDLVEHNKQIHDYCKQSTEPNGKTKIAVEPKAGEVLCTRYDVDSNWYRVMVKSCNDAKRECTGYFVDYGNTETISYDNLLRVSPTDVPTITRAPFGFFATMKDSEKLDESRSKHLLECVMNEYIMVREQGRLKDNLWRIEVPKVAYNTTFWVSSERSKFTRQQIFVL